MTFNSKWFHDRITDLGLSQRAFARKIGMSASTFNKLVNGSRDMTLEDAAMFAAQFGVSVEDVMRQAGARPPGGPTSVPLVATLTHQLDLVPVSEPRRIDMPAATTISGHLIAARCEDASSIYYGYTIFFERSEGVAFEAVGRMSVVTLKDGSEHVRFLRNGLAPGKFVLMDMGGRPEESAEVIAATPVFLAKP